MTAIIIISAVILLLVLLFSINIKLNIDSSDELVLRAGVGLFMIKLNGKKRKKVKLSEFTQKKYLKKLALLNKTPKEKLSPTNTEKTSFSDTVNFITELLGRYEEYTHRLKTHISHLNVTVAGSDAAVAAVSYGIISQSVAYLIEILDNKTILRVRNPDRITVTCDYLAEKTTYSLDITLKMSVIDAVKTLVKILMLKAQHDGNINQPKDNAEREDSSNG